MDNNNYGGLTPEEIARAAETGFDGVSSNNSGGNNGGHVNNGGYGNNVGGNSGSSIYPPVGTPPNVFIPVADTPGFGKFLLLSFVTCGIYPIIFYYKRSERLKVLMGYHSSESLMNYLLMLFVLAPLTCSIYSIIWQHKFSRLIGEELEFRNIDYSFGAKDFWLWCVLGALIIVGPFIYLYKTCKSFDLIEDDIARRNNIVSGTQGMGGAFNVQPGNAW